MIETRCLKNVVIIIQTILSFVLSRKIMNVMFSSVFFKIAELMSLFLAGECVSLMKMLFKFLGACM